jgi:hypothetical protein
MLADLSKPTPAVFATIVVSVIVVDLVILFLIRFYPDFWGKDINVWYNEFGLNAVIADVLSIVLGFLLTQLVYRSVVFPHIGWSFPVFVVLLLAVQLAHDMLFYKGVIRPIPAGHNGMIDVFKAYAAAGQGRILVADAGMMVGSALIASTLVGLPTSATMFVGSLAVYAIPYILTTRNRYSQK